MAQQQDTTLIKQLLEAGVHFGHQTKRWNPKMKKYIFGERNGVYIIDLQKTIEGLTAACNFLRETAEKGGYILFVGTKKQAQQIVKEEATRCGAFYVTERWLGGTITNFQTIRKSVRRLDEIEKMQQDGTFEALKKKEVVRIAKEKERLLKNLSGIRAMDRLPSAVYVIDSNVESTAVAEASRLSIPIVGLLDTNCDPDRIDYVIPGNDDAIRSIKLISSLVVEAILEGRRKFAESKPPSETKEAFPKTEPVMAGTETPFGSELIELAETEEEEEKEKVKMDGKVIPKRKKKIIK